MGEIGDGNGTAYPGSLDTENDLEVNSPNSGATKARAEVVNDLAAGLIAVQTELGTDPAGTLTDVKTLLQVEHGTDGTHNAITVNSIKTKSPWFDVTHPDYGATGNGATDDTVAIQAAVTAAGVVGGGVIFLPNGTYVISSSITYGVNISFIGIGRGTIIDNQSGDYAFKNVLTANGGGITFEKMKIIGTNDATAQGAIYLGDPSGGSLFVGNASIRDVQIDDFAKSGGIGIYLENPSFVSFDNVKIGNLASGTALVVRGTRVNTGVFVFNNSVFGAGTTDLGAEFGRSGDVGPVDSISCNSSTFFKGTTAAVKIFSRTVNFNGSHFEVGSGATQHILVDSWLGGCAIGCTFGGNATDPDYGIYVPSGDVIKDVSIMNNEFTSILATGACVKIDATGIDVRGVLVANNRLISTDPAILDDASGNVELKQIYNIDNSDNTTSGTGQDNLASYTIPAGYMGVQGGIRIAAAGTKTNGAAEGKTIKLRFGVMAINVIFLVTTDTDWRVEATIVNTAVNAQRVSWVAYDGATVTQGYDTATEDTTIDNLAKVTGEVVATGTDTITSTMWKVESL